MNKFALLLMLLNIAATVPDILELLQVCSVIQFPQLVGRKNDTDLKLKFCLVLYEAPHLILSVQYCLNCEAYLSKFSYNLKTNSCRSNASSKNNLALSLVLLAQKLEIYIIS